MPKVAHRASGSDMVGARGIRAGVGTRITKIEIAESGDIPSFTALYAVAEFFTAIGRRKDDSLVHRKLAAYTRLITPKKFSVLLQQDERVLGMFVQINTNQLLLLERRVGGLRAGEESVRRLSERNPGEEDAKKEGRDSAFLEEKVEFIVHAGIPLESLSV
jgi:hypothetical protein